MKPLTKALLSILEETRGLPELETNIRWFVEEKLLTPKGELFLYLQQAGIEEDKMSDFVLAQYFAAKRGDEDFSLKKHMV